MASPASSDGPRRLVEVVHMYKSFPRPSGDLEILHDVNFVLGVGELCAVIGASGAGKSTLLHCLGTLDRPTRGEIRFGGRNVLELPPAELAQFRNETIGFVFQFHHLLPEFSALENVMLPALIGRISPREARRRALEMLEGVGMSHRLTHRPGELSGGEQQRVAIARALVMQPKLLLADEPTGNLDTRTSHEVHELLFRLNQQQQITMLLVTHNLELAGQSPRVIRMADGRLVDGGPGDGDAEPESES